MSRTTSSSPGFSLIIPAWSEETRLGRTLERYWNVLRGQDRPFEVIVVADGWGERARDLTSKYPGDEMRLLTFERRLGKGGAIVEGIRRARYDLVGFVDADGPVPAEDLLQMLGQLDASDCVIGSRWLKGSRTDPPQPVGRVILGRAWNTLVRVILLLPVADTQCGAKVFRKSSILAVLPNVAVTNWAFDVDVIYHLAKSGFSVKEWPVHWHDDPHSKVLVAKAVPAMFVSLLGIRLMNLPLRKLVPQGWTDWFQRRWSVG